MREITKPSSKGRLFFILVVMALVAVDQVSKYFVLSYLKPIGRIPLIDGVFELFFLENRGAAFGLFSGFRWVFIIMTVLIVAGMLFFYSKIPENKMTGWLRLCLMLICGGAIGNWIDRIMREYVVDFLYFSLIDFPVFNIADSFLVVGSICLAILIILMEDGKKEESV